MHAPLESPSPLYFQVGAGLWPAPDLRAICFGVYASQIGGMHASPVRQVPIRASVRGGMSGQSWASGQCCKHGEQSKWSKCHYSGANRASGSEGLASGANDFVATRIFVAMVNLLSLSCKPCIPGARHHVTGDREWPEACQS